MLSHQPGERGRARHVQVPRYGICQLASLAMTWLGPEPIDSPVNGLFEVYNSASYIPILRAMSVAGTRAAPTTRLTKLRIDMGNPSQDNVALLKGTTTSYVGQHLELRITYWSMQWSFKAWYKYTRDTYSAGGLTMSWAELHNAEQDEFDGCLLLNQTSI